jgi:hypothetical protein
MLDKSSLYSRGWVLQESILAPRIIHCSRRQLYWECPSAISSEVFPKGFPKALRISDSLFSLRRLLAAPGAPMDILIKSNDRKGPESQSDINTRPAELTHSNWPEIVEMYTKCRISYPKDKLMAILGIAGAMMPKLGTYASGLWKEKLHLDLLWCTKVKPPLSMLPKQGLRTPAPKYRAPSWSWASVDDPVVFAYNKMAGTSGFSILPYIKVIDLQTTSTQPNGLGEVTSGSLTLAGGLAPISCGFADRALPDGSRNRRVMITSVDGHEFANFESGAGYTETLLSIFENRKGNRVKKQISLVQFDDFATGVDAATDNKLLCLPILVQIFFQKWTVDGLVHSDSDTYRRLGYFSVEACDTPNLKVFQDLKWDRITIV